MLLTPSGTNMSLNFTADFQTVFCFVADDLDLNVFPLQQQKLDFSFFHYFVT